MGEGKDFFLKKEKKKAHAQVKVYKVSVQSTVNRLRELAGKMKTCMYKLRSIKFQCNLLRTDCVRKER